MKDRNYTVLLLQKTNEYFIDKSNNYGSHQERQLCIITMDSICSVVIFV